MPPTKRTVAARIGRPPLPPDVRQARQKRYIGVVDQAQWDRWRLAAQVTGMQTTQFIAAHVNIAADEVLAALSPRQLSAAKRKLNRTKTK